MVKLTNCQQRGGGIAKECYNYVAISCRMEC